MSGGRVELGLGAGWYDGEHTAYGVPFPPLGERFERLEEQYAIISGLWSTPDGETFTYDGRHYQLKDSPALPKPVQSPHPPLIVGGGGAKRTPRLAATHAAEFNLPFSSVSDTEAQYDRVRAACEAQGRDPASYGSRRPRSSVAAGTRSSSSAGRRRSGASLRSCGPTAPRGRPTRCVARHRGVRRHRGRGGLPPGARPRRPRAPAPHRRGGPSPGLNDPASSLSEHGCRVMTRSGPPRPTIRGVRWPIPGHGIGFSRWIE